MGWLGDGKRNILWGWPYTHGGIFVNENKVIPNYEKGKLSIFVHHVTMKLQ